MKQHVFETRHQAFWQQFERDLDLLGKRRAVRRKIEAVDAFAAHYRTLCHHLALANNRGYSAGLCERLQSLVERAHRLLYQHKASVWQQLRRFVAFTLPQTVRTQKTFVLWAHALFYLPLLICLLLVWLQPDMLDKMLGNGTGNALGDGYSDMAQLYEQGKNRPWGQNWLMFGFYVFNNIGIGFQSFVGGLVLGIGSIFVAIFNGINIGAAMGYMLNHPAGAVFFAFVGAHGAFELTGIVLSVAGGLKLGACLLYPGSYSRKDALAIHGKDAATLICGAFLLLFVAAIIEGFWSPLTTLPLWLKYAVAALLWLVMYAYLLLGGRERAQ